MLFVPWSCYCAHIALCALLPAIAQTRIAALESEMTRLTTASNTQIEASQMDELEYSFMVRIGDQAVA